MFQHPLIPLVFSIILLLLVLKQSLTKRTLLKWRLSFSALIVFICALFVVFRHEIEKSEFWTNFSDWTLLSIDILIGLFLIVLSELSIAQEQFNQDLFYTLDQTRYYVLLDKKERIKEISTVFLNDLGLSKTEALKKNFFETIEKKYRIFSLNGTEVSKDDLKIYFANPSKDAQKEQMNLEVHDDKGDVFAYYFMETPILVFGRFQGRLFIGDKKDSDNLVGMEKNLADSMKELELIKSRFITVLEKTNEGIYFSNQTEKNIWLNDVIVQMLSLNENSMSLEDFKKRIHPDDLALYEEKLSQVNHINPNYSVSYRFDTGSRYAYVKEEGSRITNGRVVEFCGILRLLDHYHFEKTGTELDLIQGEPEMLAMTKRLFEQNKVFQLVVLHVGSIPKLNEDFGRGIGNMALSEYIKAISHRFVDENMIYRVSGLDFVILLTDYRKMDLLKNSLSGSEKLLHVTAEYGSIKVSVEAYMGISYSTEARNDKEVLAHSKEALKFALNEKFNGNHAYYKEIHQ